MKCSYLTLILLLSCTPLALLPGNSVCAEQESKAAAEPAEKKVLVKFERYGGFAGFHDNLTIFEDYTYLLGTPPHIKHHFKGTLSDERKKQLAEILSGYGTYLKEQSDGPAVADGMRTRIEINGSSADKDAKGDEQDLNRLLHQITTEARKGEQVEK